MPKWNKKELEHHRREIKKLMDEIYRNAKQEVFEDLKKLFPKTLQPLGTKKETMIPKWKAIKNIGILIDKLEKRHLSTFPKEKRHNNDFKKVCHDCGKTLTNEQFKIQAGYCDDCINNRVIGKPIPKS